MTHVTTHVIDNPHKLQNLTQNMKNITRIYPLLAAAGLVAVSASVSQAQPYYVAGSGLTPSWSPGAAANQMTGGPTLYTLSTATTANITPGGAVGGPYEEFKITGPDWSSNWPGNNVRTKPDGNGSNTFNFFPGVSTDGWSPAQNRVGYADPGGLSFEIAGDFNGWNGGAGYQLNPIGNGVYSNSIVVPTAGTYGFKFRTPGSWNDIAFGSDFGNFGANASITTTNSPQTVPVRLDLPNGRWLLGDLVVPPVTNEVVFAVDMSSQISLGNFNPATDLVFVSGAFNGWGGTGTNALALTNVPTYGGNTNIYYATNEFIGAPGSAASEYKFTSSAAVYSGSSGYEPRANNRTFNLLSTSGVELLPVASFGDVVTSDYLTEDVTVTFTLNMTNAATSTNSPSAQNSPQPYTAHAFDPANDYICINGNFLSGGWTTWDNISMAANKMVNNPPGSGIYTFHTQCRRAVRRCWITSSALFMASIPARTPSWIMKQAIP